MNDEIICYCMNVRRSQIVKAIEDGAKSLKDIQHMTKACTGNRCKELNPKGKCCNKDIYAILKKQDVTDTSSSCCSCRGDCC